MIGLALFVAHRTANAWRWHSRAANGGWQVVQPLSLGDFMTLCDNSYQRLRTRTAPVTLPVSCSAHARLTWACLICVFVAVALAGCSLSNGVGSLLVDPGQYQFYRCNDLVNEWNNLTNHEKDLRALINKADEGGGGTVIGTVAYRSDLSTTQAQEKLVQRTAAEKNCQIVPTYQSDHTIR